jgi:hypothetical protein
MKWPCCRGEVGPQRVQGESSYEEEYEATGEEITRRRWQPEVTELDDTTCLGIEDLSRAQLPYRAEEPTETGCIIHSLNYN